jgi:hypothetical protein
VSKSHASIVIPHFLQSSLIAVESWKARFARNLNLAVASGHVLLTSLQKQPSSWKTVFATHSTHTNSINATVPQQKLEAATKTT